LPCFESGSESGRVPQGLDYRFRSVPSRKWSFSSVGRRYREWSASGSSPALILSDWRADYSELGEALGCEIHGGLLQIREVENWGPNRCHTPNIVERNVERFVFNRGTLFSDFRFCPGSFIEGTDKPEAHTNKCLVQRAATIQIVGHLSFAMKIHHAVVDFPPIGALIVRGNKRQLESLAPGSKQR